MGWNDKVVTQEANQKTNVCRYIFVSTTVSSVHLHNLNSSIYKLKLGL